MRELKFRIWDKDRKEYLSPVDYDEKFGLWMCGCVIPDYLIIEQFTGLKDRRDKDIFEGDILECYDDFYDGCISERFLVRAAEDGGWEFCMLNDLDEPGGHGWYEVNKECYIIGNAYENPELLVKSK